MGKRSSDHLRLTETPSPADVNWCETTKEMESGWDEVHVAELLPGLPPERLILEGWVRKESRVRGEWRKRWLVLYRDSVTQLPMLASYADPNN